MDTMTSMTLAAVVAMNETALAAPLEYAHD